MNANQIFELKKFVRYVQNDIQMLAEIINKCENDGSHERIAMDKLKLWAFKAEFIELLKVNNLCLIPSDDAYCHIGDYSKEAYDNFMEIMDLL